jgi:hypothetical protein
MRVIVAALACAIPCMALGQQAQQQPGVQAQGNASAQGSASVQRDNAGGTAVQTQSAGGGNVSASAGKGDKQVDAAGGAATNAVLSGTLDARKAKPGDPVTAKTTEPTSTREHGQLPKGTKLIGRVTEVKAAGSGEAQSVLAFTFDRAVLKDGREIPISTTVRALAAAESAADVGDSGFAGNAGGAAYGSSRGVVGGTGGAVGGLGATAGGVVNGVGRTTGSATGSAGAALGTSSRVLAGSAGAVGGVNSRGMLTSDSHGVFGMKDVNLAQSATGSATGSAAVVSSAGRSVRLDSGTRMLLTVSSSSGQQARAAGE